MTTTAKVERECGKCRGNGRIVGYSHVAGGICFDCKGDGFTMAPADWRQREAKAAARREREAAKRAGAGDNARLWVEFTAAHPAIAAFIAEGMATTPGLGYAYSAVATYRAGDSNPEHAIYLAREIASQRGVTII